MQSQATLRTIFGLAKSVLKINDDELHTIVEVQTGKDSLRDLTQNERNGVAQFLRNMAYSANKKSSGNNHKKNKGNPITESQRKKIYWLTQELKGNGKARVRGFCEKQYEISGVEWLNSKQCSDLIEALKEIIKREQSKGE